NFGPELVGATPFWLAARFAEPGVMRLLLKHGADPLFVHRVAYFVGLGADPRSQATTALMAAVGMGGGSAWVQPERSEREALTLVSPSQNALWRFTSKFETQERTANEEIDDSGLCSYGRADAVGACDGSGHKECHHSSKDRGKEGLGRR